MSRSSKLLPVVAVIVTATFAACDTDRLSSPRLSPRVSSQIDGQLLDAVRLQQLRNQRQGCHFRVIDAAENVRAVAVATDDLPFRLPPILPITEEHARMVRIAAHVRTWSGGVLIDCVVPQQIDPAAIAAAINNSHADPRWQRIWSRLEAAQVRNLRDLAPRSLEGREVRWETLVGFTAGGTRGALMVGEASMRRIEGDTVVLETVTITAEAPPPADEWDSSFDEQWWDEPEYAEENYGDWDYYDENADQQSTSGNDETPYIGPVTSLDSSAACDQQDPKCPKKLDSTQRAMLDSALKLIKLTAGADSSCQRALDTLNAMLASGRVFAGSLSQPENLDPTDTSRHDGEHATAYDTVAAWSVMHIDDDVFTAVQGGTKTWRGLAQVTLHEAMHAMMNRADPENPVGYTHVGEGGPDYASYPFSLTSFSLPAGQGCVP